MRCGSLPSLPPLSPYRVELAHFICSPHLAASVSENCQWQQPWRQCVWAINLICFKLQPKSNFIYSFSLTHSACFTLSVSLLFYASWLHFLVKPPNRILLCGYSLRAIFIIYISKSNSKWNLWAWAGSREVGRGGLLGGGVLVTGASSFMS